jgi:myo-inositol-1(or 4)-monophosphatase
MANDLDPDRLEALRAMAEQAIAVGAEIVRHARRPTLDTDSLKGEGDYVTAVDRDSESAIRSFLQGATPDIGILGEEGGGGQGERFWAVDPLDGTTNFLIGLPVVGVSVALIDDGAPVVGAVGAPFLDLSFSAARGLGARSGDDVLRVSTRDPGAAIVATGMPFRRKGRLDRYLPTLRRVFEESEDIRRAGAAALDLAWVAAGVFDGFFELGLGIWDVAAGALLVQEAGGVVTDWTGGPAYLGGDVLAGSPQTHAVLLRAAAEA